MKNIDKINPFESTTTNTAFGKVTSLNTEVMISAHGSISFKGKTLLANYSYKADQTYNLVYTVIDTDGNVESYIEDDGILPTLFLSPDQVNYISVVPYHPDKELEISIPIFNRENTELPKGNRPFLGSFVGTSNQYAIFYDADVFSNTKPDKLLAIEFKNEAIKKKHNVKIALPRDNKICISNNQIHLLAREGDHWLHRQIDELGNLKRERKINPNQKYFRQIITLSFEEDSNILCDEDGKILLEIISPDNTVKTIQLADIGDEFYNTWPAIKIAEDVFVIQFNGEFGNGWFTIKNDQLLELFYSKGEKGYKNLVTNEVLQLDHENLVISSINKTTDNGYAIVWYPMTDRKTKNKKLIILNRVVV